jgi:hypothetical protein
MELVLERRDPDWVSLPRYFDTAMSLVVVNMLTDCVLPKSLSIFCHLNSTSQCISFRIVAVYTRHPHKASTCEAELDFFSCFAARTKGATIYK